MNEKKISFIICYNDEIYLNECVLYIKHLIIPDGYSISIHPIFRAASMTAGYEQGMMESDAKYKVYLHQDVFIINKNFLLDALELFLSNPEAGMLGMVGTKRLPDNACMWSTPMRSGALRSCVLNTTDDYFDIPISPRRKFAPVQAIDGLLMMTQYDVHWREDLFTGWDFYDVSQSMEFAKAGYRVAVPYQETPWVIHDCGFMNLKSYHTYREIFLKEYFPENAEAIQECKEKIEKWKSLGNKKNPLLLQLLSLLDEGKYEEAKTFAYAHLEENQEDYEFCILYILLQIYERECMSGNSSIFAPLASHSADWLFTHYQRIKLYLWRMKYQIPEEKIAEANEYFKENGVSELAIERIREFVWG